LRRARKTSDTVLLDFTPKNQSRGKWASKKRTAPPPPLSLQRETERGDFNDQKAARASQVPDRDCGRLFSSPFDARPSFLIAGLFHFRRITATFMRDRTGHGTQEVHLDLNTRGPVNRVVMQR